MDISGSTAYKAQQHDRERVHWVSRFKQFFVDFPKELEKTEREVRERGGVAFAVDDMPAWKIWKYVGDEILLWVTIRRHEEVYLHLNALLHAVKNFEAEIRRGAPTLGLKATAWLVNFPLPNAEVSVDHTDREGRNISILDFLGPGIDLGFRLAKFADSRRIPISAGLAFLLARTANQAELAGSIRLGYTGREAMKGIMQDRPYPIFWIDRSEQEQTLEDQLLQKNWRINSTVAANYLQEIFDRERDRYKPIIISDPQEYWNAVPPELNVQWAALNAENPEAMYEASLETPPPPEAAQNTLPDPAEVLLPPLDVD